MRVNFVRKLLIDGYDNILTLASPTLNNSILSSSTDTNIQHCSIDKPYKTTLKSSLLNDVVPGNYPITLTCTSSADPPANRYDIYLNGRHVITTSSGVLMISSAKSANQGLYTCVSANAIGQGVNNATLTVAVYGE